MRSLTLLALSAVVLGSAACGGADSRDPDRVSLASRASQDVMYSDTSVLPQVAKATGPVNGAEVFTKCAACHQTTGLGLAGSWPPLAGSEWLLGNPVVPIRIVLHGLMGPIVVKGQSYNNAMQAWQDQLSDDEIAAVLTYARSSWGNNAPAVTAEQVKTEREGTKAQTGPWNPADLKELIAK